MTAKQTALFPGNEDKVGYWLTPPDLMAKLQAEFDFDFDACPYPRPAGFDGRKESWGSRTWCNPPFIGGYKAWALKAIEEYRSGRTVVVILPVWDAEGELLAAGAEPRYIGRVRWVRPDGKSRDRGKHHALFILRPKP